MNTSDEEKEVEKAYEKAYLTEEKEMEELLPAIPPEDYKGSVGEWMVELITRGLWDEKNPEWYGDVMIPTSVWCDMLEKLEK